MVRTPFVDENGLKKGAWSAEEDNKLKSYIERYGHWNWRELPKFAGLARCGKSCRLRWKNYLRPNVKHGNYTKEEEDLLIKLHHQLGNRWSKIAASLPGRTDNEIKNYWHTHLKKRVQDQQTLSSTTKQRESKFSQKLKIHSQQIDNNNNAILQHQFTKPNLQILESCPFSPQLFNSECSSSNSEIISTSTEHNQNNSSAMEESSVSTWDTNTMGDLLDDSFWTEPFIMDMETYQYNINGLGFNILDSNLCSPFIEYWDIIDFPTSFR